jgi:hypothetical protein
MSYFCVNCKKTLPLEDKIKHELYCSSFKTNEYENLIPCEYCNEYIDFDNYNLHISHCNSSMNLINLLENNIQNFIIPIVSETPAPIQSMPAIQPLPPSESSPLPIPAIPITSSFQGITDIENMYEININTIQNLLETIINNELGPNIEGGTGTNIEGGTGTNIEGGTGTNIEGGTGTNIEGGTGPNIEGNNIMDINENIDNNYEYLINLGNTIGNVNNTIDDIDTISTTIESIELVTCPICLKKNNINRKTFCNHIFCELCLKTWIQNSKKCPICMINLDDLQK